MLAWGWLVEGYVKRHVSGYVGGYVADRGWLHEDMWQKGWGYRQKDRHLAGWQEEGQTGRSAC